MEGIVGFCNVSNYSVNFGTYYVRFGSYSVKNGRLFRPNFTGLINIWLKKAD